LADQVYLYKLGSNKVHLEDDERKIPDEYIDFVIMREMGWDYLTYQNQPDDFLDLVLSFINAERMADIEKEKQKNG